VALQESRFSILVPGTNPNVDPSAIDLESLSDLAGGLTLDAEHDGLETQRHARSLIGLGCLPKRFEASERPGISAGEYGRHRNNSLLAYLCAPHSSRSGGETARKNETLNQKTQKPVCSYHQ
jgi:hypothetical protein